VRSDLEFRDQPDAQRLLAAAVTDGPAHAYLFHGPPGVGKRAAAIAFAGELIGDPSRVARRAHPDLYLVEPLGDQIRIDEIRALRRDLHMRPFEAARRVYLVFSAELMNEDAADALLKDLEEPPAYAVVVLVADQLGPVPDTIRSRCQPVPFRRLAERTVRELVAARAPGLSAEEVTAIARVAGGRLDRSERLLDPHAARRRATVLDVARRVYTADDFEAAVAARLLLDGAADCGRQAREQAEQQLAGVDLPAREAEQRLRRVQRGAERDELLLGLEELAAWYRDLVVVATGAERVAIHADHLPTLREDVIPERVVAAQRAAELVRESWRSFEEFNLQPSLALESLFIRLRRELTGRRVVST
jgi:DNA polymerase III subunit delta'